MILYNNYFHDRMSSRPWHFLIETQKYLKKVQLTVSSVPAWVVQVCETRPQGPFSIWEKKKE